MMGKILLILIETIIILVAIFAFLAFGEWLISIFEAFRHVI